jgi:hypothetical protein
MLAHVLAIGAALLYAKRPHQGAPSSGALPAGGSKPVGASEAPATTVTPEQAHQAAMVAVAHEKDPKSLEDFARALIDWGEDPDAAHALLLRAVQLSDPHAGAV